MTWFLRLAPWYRPEEIDAREARTHRVHRESVVVREAARAALAHELDGAVAAIRRGR